MNKKLLLFAATPLLVLTSCSNPGTTPDPEPCTPTETTDVVGKVLESISGDLALKSTIKVSYDSGEGQFEEAYSTSIETVYTDSYFYFVEHGDSSDSYVRYDSSEWGGNLVVSSLDPTTNEVSEDLQSTGNGYGMYTDFFKNPFAYTNALWEDSGLGFITLLHPEHFDSAYFSNVATGGNFGALTALSIEYDENYKATTIKATSGDEWELDEFTGTVVSVDDVDVVEYPEPVAPQDGQDALSDILEAIRGGNYTTTLSLVGEGANLTFKLSVTEDAYYTEYDPTFSQTYYISNGGSYNTDKGLQGYGVNSEGKVENSNVPFRGWTTDNVLGDFYTYTGEVFNVESDGTYTLPVVSGLYENLTSKLLPDLDRFRLGVDIVVGSLKAEIINEGLKITYDLDNNGTTLKATSIVSNIGTTTIDLDFDNAIPYEETTSMREYFEKQWFEGAPEMLDEITRNHDDLIPFKESSMAYEIQTVTRGLVDPVTEEEVFYSYKIQWIYQVGNAADMYDHMSYYYSFLQSTPEYTYDPVRDMYVYSIDGVETYGVVIDCATGYQTMMSTLDYAVAVIIVNIDVPTPTPVE